jgi:hypothetical protein
MKNTSDTLIVSARTLSTEGQRKTESDGGIHLVSGRRKNTGLNKDSESEPSISGARPTPRNGRSSSPTATNIIGKIASKSSQKKGKLENNTTKRTKKKSVLVLESDTGQLQGRMPALFQNSNLNLSMEQSHTLNSLDDMLKNLSIVGDTLQKQLGKHGEMYCPETVKALCEVSREIRHIISLKLKMAKNVAKLELRKIKMAMYLGGSRS